MEVFRIDVSKLVDSLPGGDTTLYTTIIQHNLIKDKMNQELQQNLDAAKSWKSRFFMRMKSKVLRNVNRQRRNIR